MFSIQTMASGKVGGQATVVASSKKCESACFETQDLRLDILDFQFLNSYIVYILNLLYLANLVSIHNTLGLVNMLEFLEFEIWRDLCL
jgi:hypothetical protein